MATVAASTWPAFLRRRQPKVAMIRRLAYLEESIFGWANRGYPLVHDHRPAARVHPFDDKWAVLLDPERRAKLVV